MAFAPIEFLETLVHGFPNLLDLASKIRALKIEAKGLQSVTPALCVPSNDRASRRPLPQALTFAKVDLLPETGAHVPARITHQRPAYGHGTLAVVVYVLFGHVGVMPD